MARLLDDLLDVSRITRGKLQLRDEPFDLRLAIESAVEATSPLLTDRKIQLDLALPKEPVHVRGDLARLQQVCANLLSNAATYSPPGSRVELRLAAHAADVASQMVSPLRSALIQSAFGTRTPEVVPFQVKTTSRSVSTCVRSGKCPYGASMTRTSLSLSCLVMSVTQPAPNDSQLSTSTARSPSRPHSTISTAPVSDAGTMPMR